MAIPPDLYNMIREGRLIVRLTGPNNSPPHQRFWKQLDKDGPVHPVYGQCWSWVGSCLTKGGYGRLKVGNEHLLAHRYSWFLHNGEVPGDLWVLHKCDNTNCVNPAHLFIGTPQDNAVDMTDKGRHVYCKGESNPDHRLTEEQVTEIRRRHPGDASKRDRVNGTGALSREFGVSLVTIKKIVYGRAWTHV